MKLYSFNIALCFSLTFFGLAQTSSTGIDIGVTEKLFSKEIYNISQSKEGHLWIATPEGLFTFNGDKFESTKKYKNNPQEEILEIHQDKKRNLWFYGISGKVYKFEHDKFLTSKESPKLNWLNHTWMSRVFYCDSKKRNWVGNWKHGARNDVDNSAFNKNAFFISESKNNEVFFISNDGIYYEDGLFWRTNVKFGNDFRFSSYEDGFIGINLKGNIHYFDLKNKKEILIETPKLFNFEIIYSLVRDGKQFYCGTSNGLFVFEIKAKQLVLKHIYSEGTKISSVFIDDRKNLWYGTLGKGLFFLSDMRRKENYLLNKKDLNGAFSCKNNLIYVKNDIVYKYKDGEHVKIASLPSHQDKVTCLIEHKNQIIIGGNNGLYLLRESKEIERFFYEDSEGIRQGLGSIKNVRIIGGKIYVASNRGAFWIDKEKQIAFQIYENRTNDINQYNKSIYLATEQGLLKIEDKKTQIIKKGFARKIELFSGEAYVLFYSGDIFNFEVQDLRFKRINLNAEPNSTMILSEDGKLFLSNKYGVFTYSLDKKTLLSNSNPVYHMMNHGAWLYLETDEGIIKTPTNSKNNFHYKPKLLVRKIYLNNLEWSKNNLKNLKYNENNLRLELECIDFYNQDFTFNFDIGKGWVEFSQAELILNNLQAGDYELKLKVSSATSDWSNLETIHIKISQPFWRTAPFIILMVCISLLLVYLFFRIRVLTYNRDVVRDLLQLFYDKIKRDRKLSFKNIKDGTLVIISVRSLLYVEAAGNYCEIHHLDGKITVRGNLKELHARFLLNKQLRMVRIHRSFLINIDEVKKIGPNGVFFGDILIPHGKNEEYKKAFKEIRLKSHQKSI